MKNKLDKLIEKFVKRHTTKSYITRAFGRLNIPELIVLKDVFRPNKSFSGKYLARVLFKNKHWYKNVSVLDLGAGSGLLGLICAKNGAKEVLCTDINPVTVRNILLNAELLGLKNVRVLMSNVFRQVPKQKFDLIIFNPPGFTGTPKSLIEATLVSSDNILESFFKNARGYLSKDGCIIMPTSTAHSTKRSPTTLALKYKYHSEIVDTHKGKKDDQFTVMLHPIVNS